VKQRFLKYLDKIEGLLQDDNPDTDWQDILSEHLEQIRFFQHERLAHLIVTVTFAVILILMMNLLVSSAGVEFIFLILVLFFVVAVMLILYILYYFFLEKSVLKLYGQYDQILLKKRKMTQK